MITPNIINNIPNEIESNFEDLFFVFKVNPLINWTHPIQVYIIGNATLAVIKPTKPPTENISPINVNNFLINFIFLLLIKTTTSN